MITIYTADGKKEQLSDFPWSKTMSQMKWLQRTVGGYIQLVKKKDGSQIICDEEGKLKKYDINHDATRELWEPDFGRHDVLVGTIVHLTGKDRLK